VGEGGTLLASPSPLSGVDERPLYEVQPVQRVSQNLAFSQHTGTEKALCLWCIYT